MVEELRNIIIFDYAKNKRTIDENFYRRIASVFSKHYEIEDYIKDVLFEDIDEGIAYYSNCKKMISLNIENVDSYVDVSSRDLPNFFNDKETGAFNYLESARVILHELSHAMQARDSDKDRLEELPEGRRRFIAGVDPFFSGNVIYSIQHNGEEPTYDRLKKWNDYMKKETGCNIVHERDAEMHSYSIIFKILNESDNSNEFQNLQKFIRAKMHQVAMMGYTINERGEVISPLYNYAKVLRKGDMIAPYNIEWYSDTIEETTKRSCSTVPKLSDRLKHGMPITPQEYLRMQIAHSKYIEKGYISAGVSHSFIDENR